MKGFKQKQNDQEGEVKIKSKKNTKSNNEDDLGEYVDFEEIDDK
jgi:hypothetical protein